MLRDSALYKFTIATDSDISRQMVIVLTNTNPIQTEHWPGWCVRLPSMWNYTCRYSTECGVASYPGWIQVERACSSVTPCQPRRSSPVQLLSALRCPGGTVQLGMLAGTRPAWMACSLLHSYSIHTHIFILFVPVETGRNSLQKSSQNLPLHPNCVCTLPAKTKTTYK